MRDESLLASDFRSGSLPAGPPGQPGADGSPDTAEQVRSKLQTVDGAGSGIDSDLLDGHDGSDFVADADNAGGDLSGTF